MCTHDNLDYESIFIKAKDGCMYEWVVHENGCSTEMYSKADYKHLLPEISLQIYMIKLMLIHKQS